MSNDDTRISVTEDFADELDELEDLGIESAPLAPTNGALKPWRQGYPYDKKLPTDEYEATKRKLQIELLKLQLHAKETGIKP